MTSEPTGERQVPIPRTRRLYRWWYDHVQSLYYDLLMLWCFLPFGGERRFRLELLRSIEFRPDERILEMCCGTGNSTLALASLAGAGSKITAIDLSVGQLRRALKKPYATEVSLFVMDASATAFTAHTFDKIFIPHALHEMSHQLRLEVLREAQRLLVPGGEVVVLELANPPSLLLRLFVGFWFFYWLPFNFETPTRRDMFRRGLENELREAGLGEVTKQSTHDGVFQVVRGVA
jgi:demethylmenaquinone methyltransferase/2-methoxy-6-polyprenyl-1,4-benzoquinol methylase